MCRVRPTAGPAASHVCRDGSGSCRPAWTALYKACPFTFQPVPAGVCFNSIIVKFLIKWSPSTGTPADYLNADSRVRSGRQWVPVHRTSEPLLPPATCGIYQVSPLQTSSHAAKSPSQPTSGVAVMGAPPGPRATTRLTSLRAATADCPQAFHTSVLPSTPPHVCPGPTIYTPLVVPSSAYRPHDLTGNASFGEAPGVCPRFSRGTNSRVGMPT